ncbi:DNA alkylation repair protein [Candidatus Curtissbacteria bacterium RBG_13_35_7]|uniref:DNA alkylation repair protein n=1 Tax=Candidatus Curtissbacteria bacterium RBG_13_35_7 TaxID=1797705 RepID=A0A1F5G3B2_9BACT|nr:MAG: DNA alkylation repair protein [Candidatus Curtissbacteria bacterium RBG_13_35_7]
MQIGDIECDLQRLKNPKKAQILSRYFKTQKGQYGQGDIFLGITVPRQRQIAKKYKDIDIKSIQKLLISKIHEYRLTAILILVSKYQSVNEREKQPIVKIYLKNTKYINNWDLVDLSADKILGQYLINRDKSILYKLAKSTILWERRIAIMATFAFIKKNQFNDTFRLAKILLYDKHDLIHKAVGWMLREIGKHNQKAEETFLNNYYKQMPRTMLRYSIEKFTEFKRKKYLKNRI